jgi:hypothetical protein
MDKDIGRLNGRAAMRLTALVVLLICPACSSGRVPVRGEVTFDGKAVEDGTISLEPADGKGSTTGGKITAGKYELTGNAAPLAGKKTVRIFAVRKTGRKIAAQFAPSGTMIDDVESYIPKSYNANSTLTCEVSSEASKQIDFNLKSK